MKKLLLLSLIIIGSNAFGQSKMNFDLARKAKQTSTSSAQIDVFVQGNIDQIRQLTEAAGGTFKYSAKDIAAIHIPASALSSFVSNNSIKRVEAYPQRNKPMNDTMLINSNIVPVHAGTTPLLQPYNGDSVIIGFIDTGIDFSHPDFQDSTGNTRILHLWDQTLPVAANTPSYGYGQEWNNMQIDSGQAAAHTDVPWSGHGTHVAGVATGNGLATGTYLGAAPKADIIMVALDFSSSAPTLITDAVDYIYSKAAAAGKPCVINASLGDYYGSHDGLDLQAQLIDAMITAQPGQAFVSAAGNGGGFPFHLGYTVTSDTNFTWFSAASGDIYIPMYADTADFDSVEFAIGADEMTPQHLFRGRTNFSKISDHPYGMLGYDTIYNGSNRIATMLTYADIVGGVCSMEFLITPDSSAYNFRLITTGTGKFDCWTFDVNLDPLPNSTALTDSIYYKLSDTDQTIVSSFNCLDNVISVGNYMNRATYTDYNNTPYFNNSTPPGSLSSSSSHGPTRDGRTKPDVCAPGDMTVAAAVLAIVPDVIAFFPDALAQGGFHIRDGGSSHAAPGVSGIVALYLQMDPTATAAQIKQDIICTAKQDTFTGSTLPDNTWGYGKANAFAALVGCSPTAMSNLVASEDLNIYPNPAVSGNILNVEVQNTNTSNKTQLFIHSAIGALVETAELKQGNNRLNLDLESGIYFCTVLSGDKKIASKKLVIMK